MRNKPFILMATLCMAIISGVYAQTTQPKVSILGDSYSTFLGHVIPDTNACWYGIPENESVNDVRNVEETWWYQLLNELNYSLEQNNSFSGSTICNTGYNGEDYSDRSFITRMDNLGNPDIILIFGGTNDSWAGAPLGEYQYEGWNKEDLYKVRPAFCYLLSYMTENYPNTKIYNITNTELSTEVETSMDEICTHYKIKNIKLKHIDKQAGHPSINGMKAISQQVKEGIGK